MMTTVLVVFHVFVEDNENTSSVLWEAVKLLTIVCAGCGGLTAPPGEHICIFA